MCTAGPWPEGCDKQELKSAIASLTNKCFGANVKEVQVAMEISGAGYRHFHIIVHLAKQSRWMQWNKAVLQYVRKLPLGVDEHRKPNSRVDVFGIKERDPWGAAKKYLHQPSKEKLTDDDVMEFEPPIEWFWYERAPGMWEKYHYDKFKCCLGFCDDLSCDGSACSISEAELTKFWMRGQ